LEKLRLRAGAWENPLSLWFGGISMKLTVMEFAPVEADPVPLETVEVFPAAVETADEVVETADEDAELPIVMLPEQSELTV
jgi:hypothetical protein